MGKLVPLSERQADVSVAVPAQVDVVHPRMRLCATDVQVKRTTQLTHGTMAALMARTT